MGVDTGQAKGYSDMEIQDIRLTPLPRGGKDRRDDELRWIATVDAIRAELLDARNRLDPSHPSCLEGYRELGARCASIENAHDATRSDLSKANALLGEFVGMYVERQDEGLATRALGHLAKHPAPRQ